MFQDSKALKLKKIFTQLWKERVTLNWMETVATSPSSIGNQMSSPDLEKIWALEEKNKSKNKTKYMD